jgi:SAM-dependent MidA family methyltransferase
VNPPVSQQPVPFAEFMASALHDPHCGYYARRIRTVGARGDFATAATLFPAFGTAVARWLATEAHAHPGLRHVIEVGAGDGSLMAGVRRCIGLWRRLSWSWHIVESSPVLRDTQRARLGSAVVWHERLEQALAATRGEALIYHNELLDAFPAQLLEKRHGAWREVHVRPDGGESLVELAWPESERGDFSALASWQAPEGQRVELHRSVRDWLRGWSPHWRRGAMLTVDYGGPFPELYRRRPRGTLRAYLLHQRLEGAAVYANPGRQDITADINFTDLQRWAGGLGWCETEFSTLGEFLARRLPPKQQPAALLDLDGAGGAFRCIVHRTGSPRA